MTALELAANALATLSIVLAARNHRATWPVGIAGCALFGLLFFQVKLYADVVLQVFFITTSAVGWWGWQGPGAAAAEMPIRRTSRRAIAALLLVGLLAGAGYGGLLMQFTDAAAPVADSLVLSLSVIAQLLLMRRRIETWPFWLAVNLIAVPLYASRGLTLTAALYAFYAVNAVWAWRHWQRLSRR